MMIVLRILKVTLIEHLHKKFRDNIIKLKNLIETENKFYLDNI